MNKITVAVIVVILASFGGLVAWSSMNSNAVDYGKYDATKIIAADSNNGEIGDHVRGKKDSPVVMVEYTDMQCSGCASALPTMKEIYDEYEDRVAFVFRNFPISGHQNARAAAAAAESAGMQGYYWEMIDALYTNQASWYSLTGAKRTEEFVSLFQQVVPDGDAEAFRTNMSDERIEKKISFDYALGSKVQKVNETPSFFVNGIAIKVGDAKTQDELKENIEKKLDEALSKNGLETGKKENSKE